MNRSTTDPLGRSGASRFILLSIHGVVVAIALLVLLSYMVLLVTASFRSGTALGLRSLAATVLPFTAITYVGLFTNIFRLSQRVPVFNLYVVFTLWTIFLLGFVQVIHTMAFPLGELLFSTTLAATVWRYGRRSFNVFLSCCYGIVTGTIVYIVFSGSSVLSA